MAGENETLKTGVDLLIDLVKKHKSISLDEASKKLNIPVSTLEMWARFLEEEGELGIDYKFTTPYLTTQKPKQVKDKPEKYDFSGTSVQNSLNIVVDMLPKAQQKLQNGKMGDAKKDFSSMVESLKGLSFHTHGWFEKNKPEESKKIKDSLSKITSGINRADELAQKGNTAQAKKEYQEKGEEIKKLYDQLAEMYQQIKGDVESELIQGLETGNIRAKSKPAEPPKPKKPRKIRIVHTTAKDEEINKLFDSDDEVYVVEDTKARKGEDLSGAKHARAVHMGQSQVDKDESLFSGQSSTQKHDESAEKETSGNQEDEHKYQKPLTEQDRLERLAQAAEKEGDQIIDQGRSETKHAAQEKSMSEQALRFLDEGRTSEAAAVLTGLYKTYAKLPSAFIAKKNELKHKLLEIFNKLYMQEDKTDHEMLEKTQGAINSGVKELEKLISENNLNGALSKFEELKKSYESIPEHHIKERISLLKRIHKAHESLLKLRKVKAQKDFEDIQKRFHEAYADLEKQLQDKNVTKAKESYAKLSKIYADIPKGFAEERLVIQEKILTAYRELILEEQKSILEKHHQLKDKINNLIAKVRQDIGSSDVEKIEKNRSQISELYTKISGIYMNDKSRIQDEILALDLELCKYKDESSERLMRTAEKSIKDALDKAERFMRKEQYELANELFSSIITSIHNSPEGFVERKQELVNQAYKMYDELYKKLDQHFLENADAQTREMYELMLEKLVLISEKLQEGELDEAAKSYHQLVQIYTKLPVGFLLKNAKIKAEVLKIHDMYKAYKMICELQSKIDELGPKAVVDEMDQLNKLISKFQEKYKDDKSYFKSIEDEYAKLEQQIIEKLEGKSRSETHLEMQVDGENSGELPPLPAPPKPGEDSQEGQDGSYSSEDVKKSFKPIAPIDDLELENSQT